MVLSDDSDEPWVWCKKAPGNPEGKEFENLSTVYLFRNVWRDRVNKHVFMQHSGCMKKKNWVSILAVD